jgi:hypothetical protein
MKPRYRYTHFFQDPEIYGCFVLKRIEYNMTSTGAAGVGIIAIATHFLTIPFSVELNRNTVTALSVGPWRSLGLQATKRFGANLEIAFLSNMMSHDPILDNEP